ncbi:Short-chain dehydrogenase [Sphingomonas sp. EC-HK361]|jgi:NAD(P)-dependent dehydrogenase (short-subunit alcohol dehydrogenase family)|uniref:SDR family NAD(P)-dependent oxidoreductase n=1 Tax=Sphingomonas sp. EC-HK361 TaxID=2038397 RepID=UPI0012554134|nr:SDR family NAD(P)-dependent oxidoreductase [Sphingomonas sp. EC-HK361]VVT07238.1 Short-chain dehydrogenase [Sphingomonas sp. EC-HK361]
MSAVVIGASGGIGKALADAIEDEGVDVHRLARSFGSRHIDLTDEESIAAAATTVGSPDLVIVATGLLHDGEHGPEKAMRDLDPTWLARNFATNAVGPALVAKHFLPVMPRSGRCIFAALSARIGSISDNRLGGWYGYRASKAALNQFIRTIAIEERRRNDGTIVVGLHPGTVDTALSKPFQGNVGPGRRFAPDRAAVQLLDVLDGLKAPDSGKVFDWEGREIAP